MVDEAVKQQVIEYACAFAKALQVLGTLLALMIWGAIKAVLPYSVLPKKSVHGELVLITGAGGGFGRLLAVKFAKLGANLILWDISKDLMEETAKQCREHGVTVKTYIVDLNNKDNTYAVGSKTKEEHGDIDILVNNAGIISGKPLVDLSDDQISRTMTINAISHFWMLKLFLPSMLKRNRGHIVSVASAAGMHGAPMLTDYCSSKYAAVGLFESLVLELLRLGKNGVKTTLVCPTFMDTGMFQGAQDMALMPVMKPEFVAERAMNAILSNTIVCCVPKMVYILSFIKSFMPVDAGKYLAVQLKVTESMDHFQPKQ